MGQYTLLLSDRGKLMKGPASPRQYSVHTAQVGKAAIQEYGFVEINHPPYSWQYGFVEINPAKFKAAINDDFPTRSVL